MNVHIVSAVVITYNDQNAINITVSESELEDNKVYAHKRGWYDSVMVGKFVRVVREYGKVKFYDIYNNTLYCELG